MDIFGIPDPDPPNKRCGSATPDSSVADPKAFESVCRIRINNSDPEQKLLPSKGKNVAIFFIKKTKGTYFMLKVLGLGSESELATKSWHQIRIILL